MSAASERVSTVKPPSGTVTFLFTDIEASTRRWEGARGAMQAAVQRHDGLVRAAILEAGGYVFKTIGDAFCVAFARPEDAVAAALAAQRSLRACDFSAVDGLNVRMALHSGTTDERDGDYFGPTVNRVARLLSVANGGQVLLSGVTADLARGSLAHDVALRDLGNHRLKDLAVPEHVYQLLAPDLPFAFPALRSLDTIPNNLPLEITSFVGRQTDVADIAALLASNRLVTLVGSGGIGKTRTSLHVAANVLERFEDGVWFVELAPLSSADLIPTTIALSLGANLPSNGEPIENLVRLVGARRALFVFDNCEHLVEGAAHVVAALLRYCAGIVVLASSHQALQIAGETVYRMPSLNLPQRSDVPVSASDALACSAIALFVERARTSDHRFSLTDENAPIVVDICRRLDGIPFAIELAAARVKMLNPRQLRDRLDERFRVLTGGRRDAVPRQQTLRALMDWSHDLLDERERRLFRRLGIFVDGFTMEGAVATGCGDGLDEFDVLDLLSTLVDKSLVLAEPAAEAFRYRLFESTRAYAREKLEAANESERTARRHLAYFHDRFLALFEHFEQTAKRKEIFGALVTELEDVRAALDFGLGADVRGGAELLTSTSGVAWQSIGLQHEIVSRAEAYLAALAERDALLRARLWSDISFIVGNLGLAVRAVETSRLAVSCARTSGNTGALCAALQVHATSLLRSRRFEDAESALAEAAALPDISPRQHLALESSRATAPTMQGDFLGAMRAQERLVEEYRKLGDPQDLHVITVNLAESVHALGDTERAIALLRGILPDLRSSRDHSLLKIALVNVAGYLVAVDEFAESAAMAREAVRELARPEPTSPYIAASLEPLALVLALGGDPARAAVLEGYADAALGRAGLERGFSETKTYDRLAAVLDARLAPDELTRKRAEGVALAPAAAIELALSEP